MNNKMKEIFKSQNTGLKVYVSILEDAMTFEKKIEYLFMNESGCFSAVQYIPLAPLLNGRTLDKFYNYGFTKSEIDELTERLKKELPSLTKKATAVKLPFTEIYKGITAYADQEEDCLIEGRDCLVEVHKFQNWFETEDTGWKYLDFLRTLRMLGLLKNNNGRLDYRRKSDGIRYYRFRRWEESSSQANLGTDSPCVEPIDRGQKLGGAA